MKKLLEISPFVGPFVLTVWGIALLIFTGHEVLGLFSVLFGTLLILVAFLIELRK